MRFLTSSIRTKIIFPYILLTLIVGMAGAFAATRLIFDTVEERLNNQLVGAGRVVNKTIIDQEIERLAILRQVSNTKGMAEAQLARDYAEIEEIVIPIANNAPKVDSIVILDDQAREVFKLDRVPSNKSPDLQPPIIASEADYTHWPVVNKVLSGQMDQFGDKYTVLAYGKTRAEDLLYSVGPMRSEDRIIGAVLIGSYLSNALEDMRLKSLAHVTFYQGDGQVVQTTFNQTGAPEVLTITPEFYDRVVTEKEVLKERLSLLGHEYALAFTPFQLRGDILGVYSVGLSTDFVFAPTMLSRNIFTFIIFIAIVILFFIALIVTQQIIKPLAQLVRTSRAIAAGRLDLETGIASRDEIGHLAETFDQMTAQLRRRTEELQELVRLQSAILRSIVDGVLVQDHAGNITQINPAARKILSQMSETFTDYRPDDHIPLAKKFLARLAKTPPDQQGDDDPIKERTSATQPQIFATEPNEAPPRSFDIGSRSISTRAAPVVTDAEETLGTVVVLRDITLEVEADKLKNTLISSVSHELLTPVASLKGYLQLFEMISNGKLDDRQQNYIHSIYENADDLHNLISTLIDFVEIEHDEGGFEFEELDLDELVKDVSESNQEKIDNAGLIFILHLWASPLEVRADENRIRRILGDLLDNAVNYNRPGGSVDLYVTQDKGFARVDVVDTGRGITKSVQPDIITQPFTRDLRDDDKIRGNGLSLYLAGKIITAHKGKIWFESEVNKGSTFSFAIPLIKYATPSNKEAVGEKIH